MVRRTWGVESVSGCLRLPGLVNVVTVIPSQGLGIYFWGLNIRIVFFVAEGVYAAFT